MYAVAVVPIAVITVDAIPIFIIPIHIVPVFVKAQLVIHVFNVPIIIKEILEKLVVTLRIVHCEIPYMPAETVSSLSASLSVL